jgi:hypothetical protein
VLGEEGEQRGGRERQSEAERRKRESERARERDREIEIEIEMANREKKQRVREQEICLPVHPCNVQLRRREAPAAIHRKHRRPRALPADTPTPPAGPSRSLPHRRHPPSIVLGKVGVLRV